MARSCSLVYQTLLKGTGALLKGTHGEFKKIIGKFPHLAYTYNDMEKYTSADTDMKKATALSTGESPDLATVKDVRTIYVAPLLKLEEQIKSLNAEMQAASESRDTGRAMELDQEISDVKSEMNKIGSELWPFIAKVKKELVACLDEMKAVKTGDAFTFKLGQGEEVAAAPQAAALDPADKSVIKIFDFDGTLFNTSKFFASSGISNLFAVNFYTTYLKPSIKKSFLKRVGERTEPMALSAELKADPDNTYVVTTVASSGVDKRVDYFAHLFQKKDETIIKFLQFLNQNREDRGSKTPEETYAEIYPKWIATASGEQAASEPAKAEPAVAAKKVAPAATAPVSGQPPYPSREDFRKNTKVAKDYKKWVYEKGNEDDQMGYEADRDAALDDNDHYDALDENKTVRVKTLREHLLGIRFKLGTK